MRKKYLFPLLMCSFHLIYSQEPFMNRMEGTIVTNLSAPSSAQLERYETSPMNYYNGSAGFNIPIYTIKSGNIIYPISINYSLGGIQVNQRASDIGLGWGINSTIISRTIIGGPDLETILNGDHYGCKTSVDEIRWERDKLKIGYMHLDKYTEEYSKVRSVEDYRTTNLDFFPDIFNFYSPSYNTKFFFINEEKYIDLESKNTIIENKILSKKYHYLELDNYPSGRIIENQNICVTDYDKFKITTNDGISYFFEDKDIIHSFSDQGETGSGLMMNKTYPRVSTWHISKIIDNATKDEVNFIYEKYSPDLENRYFRNIANDEELYIPFYEKPIKKNNSIDDKGPQCFLSEGGHFFNDDDYHINRYYTRYLHLNRIKKIIFKEGSINFYYEKNRDDFRKGKMLTKIDVRNIHDQIIKSFVLNQDYFYSEISKNINSKRLKLESIKNSEGKLYKFEYFEDIKMPNIGSVYQDFFGYCNQREKTIEKKASNYYYYPNEKQYSILPYNINQKKGYNLKGDINKEPNDLSKTWSLKKVTFPTGGYILYDLESNEFNLWGENLKGGGVRVKKQESFDHTGNKIKSINYKYVKNDNNESSGILLNVPYVGFPGSHLFKPKYSLGKAEIEGNFNGFDNLKDYFFLYSDAKENFDLKNDFFIGYDRIEEIINDSKSIYVYPVSKYPNVQARKNRTFQRMLDLNISCMSSFLINNSAKGTEIYNDRSFLRKKATEIYKYKDDKLVQKIENEYDGIILDYDDDEAITPYAKFYGTTITEHPVGIGGIDELFGYSKFYHPIYNNLVKKKVTNYYNKNSFLEEEYTFLYNEFQNIVFKGKKLWEKENMLPIYRSWYYIYPDTRYNLNHLTKINKINIPFSSHELVGETDFDRFGEGTIYNVAINEIKYDNNSLLPTSSLSYDLENPTKTNQNITYTYTQYDNKGNLLEYRLNGITPVVIIWGYHQTLPIAKIEGATYEQVKNLVSDIISKSNEDKDEVSEKNLITALDNFRNKEELKNFQITTYTHNPLIGVTSITPPSGIREIYKYDDTNRLKQVLDIHGNILKEYQYNYRQP